MTEITAVLYRWVKGNSQREIYRSLGLSRNTVRSMVRAAKQYGLEVAETNEDKILDVSQKIFEARRQHQERSRPAADKLKPYHDQIKQWLDSPYMTVKQIWRLLHEQTPAVQIGLSSLHRYVREHFQERAIASTMMLPTIPGEQAQVDFGYVGLMHDPVSGKNKKAQAFIMTLSHSRHRFVYFVFRQDATTWVDCHRRAFEFFNGVPKTILLDNLKAGVLKADCYDPTINRSYAECERHYGFVADPAKVRTPQHKGKVERSVTIVKQQVVSGREFTNIHEANKYARQWSQEIIGHTVTRTTGETPLARFLRDDKPALLPLPDKPFDCPIWAEAKVGRDQHVTYQGSFYSVPERYIEQAVSIRISQQIIRFYQEGALVKTHTIATRKGEWQTDITDLSKSAQHYLQNTPELCVNEAKSIGKETLRVIRSVFDKNTETRRRKARAILRLAEVYGATRLESACKRALTFDNIKYQTLKNILLRGLDSEPEEGAQERSTSALTEGAFLREPSEFMIH